MLETIEKMVRVHAQAAERHAERGTSGERGRPQHLSLLARIHGSVCAAIPAGRRATIVGGCCGTTPDHIKEIRSEARSFSRRNDAWLSVAGGDSHPEAQGAGEGSRGGQKPFWERSWRPDSSSRSSRFFLRAASMRRRKSRREAVQGGRDRLHQCPGWSAGQRSPERAGDLPADPAAGRDRGGSALLLPGPQYSRHPERTARRACHGRAQSDLHYRRSAADGTYPDATAVFDVDSIGLTTSSTI